MLSQMKFITFVTLACFEVIASTHLLTEVSLGTYMACFEKMMSFGV